MSEVTFDDFLKKVYRPAVEKSTVFAIEREATIGEGVSKLRQLATRRPGVVFVMGGINARIDGRDSLWDLYAITKDDMYAIDPKDGTIVPR